MVVIVVPGLRADDLARPELPILRLLLPEGAFGWMNTRTARVAGQRREPEEAAYLTLGAGSRATAGLAARNLTPERFERLKADNARLDHPVSVGALGDMLHAAGLRTAVIGNEDDTEQRSAAKLIAVDSRGGVDLDRTGPVCLRANPDEPYGLQADPAAYAAGQGFDLQVWVFGDIARADRYAPLCVPAMAARHRRAALERLNALLISCHDSQGYTSTRYVLLAPTTADSAPFGDRLAPILLFGAGPGGGLVSSGSTHRAGLVTNTDFLPTVAAYFGLKAPAGSVGRPMTVSRLESSPSDHPKATPEEWAGLHDEWASTAAKQAAFGGLPTLQFVLVLSGTALWYMCRSSRSSARLLLRSLALAVVALPLAQLLLPPISPRPLWAAALILGIVVVAIALIGSLREYWTRVIGFALMGGLVLAVAVDLLTGGHLMQEAWMSYSVMEGARYYGIGNEYAGAVFTAALIASSVLLRGERSRHWPVAFAMLCLLAILIGLPAFGAKAGGFLGTAIGFGVAGLVWWRGRLRARDVAAVLLVAVVLLGGVLAVDLLRGGAAQTHIGRAIGDGGSLVNIGARKAALNGYLLLHSPWSLALLAALAGLWLLWRAPDSSLRKLVETDRIARGAAAGLAIGMIALFLFDDSGVVAAANATLLAWATAIQLRPATRESA